MKIAIKANPNRGKEIISLLESLGGSNPQFNGNGEVYTYYIDNNSIIRYDDAPKDYKVYTLEEFEKEFPFKVGDKVIHKEFNDLFEVIAFNPELTYPYKIKGVCEFNTKGYVLTKWQPKMKEERFVTLTLDKAKEWYKKGGELKEIALQAFTEKELNPLPKSWEEFCEKYPVKETEAIICCDSSIADCKGLGEKRDSEYYRDICPSKKSAEAHLAMIQLEQLRNCWWNGWKPEWNNCEKYVIKWDNDDLIVFTARNIRAFLVFPTREMAYEFLKCFRDLIEKAGDLI